MREETGSVGVWRGFEGMAKMRVIKKGQTVRDAVVNNE